VHFVFYNEAGVYLSIDYLNCPDVPSKTCISVWKSVQVDPIAATPAPTAETSGLASATANTSYSKKTPADGSTNLNPSSISFSWQAYSPTPDKYSYCIQEGSACASNDPDWTSTYNTSVTITNLTSNKTYYWQVRAVTCVTCTPKQFAYYNNDDSWTFTTKTGDITILGNAGVGGAVLSYVNSSAKTVTADSAGSYSIILPYGWSGTITPSKAGYTFIPVSASFTNVTASQTIQNFAATPSYTISGNVRVAGIKLNYTYITARYVTSDANGNYAFAVPAGWSGTVVPTRNGFPFTPASRSYTNLSANQANQNYSDAWVGAITVTSDKNIVSVARPQIGAEIASYDGFASGSLTSYVPMLFKNAYGSYNSALYVQNVNSGSAATITINYYDTNGVLNCTKTDSISALSSKGYWIPTETCDSGSLPNGWIGAAIVTSSQPIVTVGRPQIGTEIMTYDGFASGGTTSYIPMLFKGAYGGTYNSAFYIQNVSTSTQATITMKYYDTNGNLNCTKADTIQPRASKGYWVPTETCDTGSIPPGWIGGVIVTSSQPIVSVGRPHIGTQVTTYNGFTTGNPSSYVPMLFKNAYGGSYNAAFYLQNTTSSSATVTIKYYSSTGSLDCTKTDTIAPLASVGYWLPSATCDSGSLPVGWVGGAVVTSNQPIVGVGRPHIGTQVTTYNGLTAGSANSYLPMLFKEGFDGTYNGAFYVQNTDNSSGSVTIKFYDTTGALSCSRTDTLPALATLGYWMQSVTCTP
ncbi:MAG: fibronectin type III domain-containing protein, partial [Bacteroidota bacterium]